MGLTIAAPITIWVDNRYMIGYINSIVYHNPTRSRSACLLSPYPFCHCGQSVTRGYRDANQLLLAVDVRVDHNGCDFEQAQLHDRANSGFDAHCDLATHLGSPSIGSSCYGACSLPSWRHTWIEYLFTFHSGIEHGGAIVFAPLSFMPRGSSMAHADTVGAVVGIPSRGLPASAKASISEYVPCLQSERHICTCSLRMDRGSKRAISCGRAIVRCSC